MSEGLETESELERERALDGGSAAISERAELAAQAA